MFHDPHNLPAQNLGVVTPPNPSGFMPMGEGGMGKMMNDQYILECLALSLWLIIIFVYSRKKCGTTNRITEKLQSMARKM